MHPSTHASLELFHDLRDCLLGDFAVLRGGFYIKARAILMPKANSELFELLVSYRTEALRQNSDQKDHNHIERRSR